ncbi:hypothetical protein CBR_g30623 [Chara braunii]|uniref:Uncharacterized protein n=1 Tax=Chara braunii TaxID=69332 RepID=A0A388LDA4_CHABU|nr:hypothetical protein CBR_g30623 [Chara braunii]|eukprot:GBG80257.1 hypothetical protein CBR_g30623 [Chara braunii]
MDILPRIPTLKAVLFDVDGTLADSDPLHLLAFQELLAEIGFNDGVPIDKEFFVRVIAGRHNPDIVRDLFPEWPPEEHTKFCDAKERKFRELAMKLVPVDGLLRLTAWVEEKGLHRAAVTNAPRENVEQMLKTLGLDKFFETVVIGCECKRPKPFPDPYQQALEYFGLKPEEAFVFEDSPSGVEAGVAAGMKVVGIATGNPASSLQAAGACMVLSDYNEPLLWKALT